jgi:hypothetical protein
MARLSAPRERRFVNTSRTPVLARESAAPIRAKGAMMRVVAAASAAMLLVLASTASSAPPAVDVELQGTGTLVSGGSAVDVALTVTCHPRFEVLEANLSVSQENASGFTGFAVPRCNNRPRTVVVRVTSFGEPFQPGSASASAFVLVLDRGGTDETRQDQDAETIQLAS